MTDQHARPQELRLALGMRGGVSLAVWIGGACREIEALRGGQDDFWRGLREVAGYEEVTVDVMAGASAGGLNGAIYAASLQYGLDMTRLRGIWLELGQIEQLMRRVGPDEPMPSLLDGDGAFLAPLHAKLSELLAEAEAAGRGAGGPPIDLQLSATHVEPIRCGAPSPDDEQLQTTRFAGRFHFRQGTERWDGSDFPQDGPARDAAVWRLAVAARATSSYPAAFEAAAVRSTRPASFTSPPVLPPPTLGPLVDMRGIFSDSRGRSPADDEGAPAEVVDTDFIVADGGILDNIPLAKALRAIAGASADRPTDRVLAYLHPGAPAGVTGGGRRRAAPARRSTLSVATGAARTRLVAETINEDIDELERHNRRVQLGQAMRIVMLSQVRDRSLTELARDSWSTYGAQRSGYDADLIRGRLEDPVGQLGGDPFPFGLAGQEVADGVWGAPLSCWSRDARQNLDAALLRTFAARFTPRAGVQGAVPPPLTDLYEPAPTTSVGRSLTTALYAGVGPLTRVCKELLEWVRFAEKRGWDGAGAAKVVIYRVLTFSQRVLDVQRTMAWVVAAVQRGRQPDDGAETVDDLAGWARGAAKAADRLLLVAEQDADALLRDLFDGGPGAGVERILQHSAQVLDGGPDLAAATDLRRPLFDRLATTFDQALRASQEAIGTEAPRDEQDQPGWSLDRALRSCHGVTAEVLAAVEVVLMPEHLVGVPGERPISFVRLSAGNRTPIASAFVALRHKQAEMGLDVTPYHLAVALKLAGNEVMNFAAFLKPDWRANDWMWGRLDAVPTLVDQLVDVDRLSAWVARVGGPQAALQQLKEVVTGGWEGWRAHLEARVWTPFLATRYDGPALPGGAAPPCVDLAGTIVPAEAIEAIRNALVARRQWEIVADELAQPPYRTGSRGPDRLSPEDAGAALERYAVGAQTLTAPRERSFAEAAARMSDIAAETLIWNAGQLKGGTLSSPSLIQKVVGRAARVGGFGGRVAAQHFLSPRPAGVLGHAKVRATTLGAAVVGLVLAAALWGFFRDWQAAAAGALVSLAVVTAVTGLLLYLSARTRRAVDNERSAAAALAVLSGALAIVLGVLLCASEGFDLRGGDVTVGAAATRAAGIVSIVVGVAFFIATVLGGRRKAPPPRATGG